MSGHSNEVSTGRCALGPQLVHAPPTHHCAAEKQGKAKHSKGSQEEKPPATAMSLQCPLLHFSHQGEMLGVGGFIITE